MIYDRNNTFNQRSVGKRKMLPQIPNRPLSSAESLPPNTYGPKSLPATPSSSTIYRSRQLPTPAPAPVPASSAAPTKLDYSPSMFSRDSIGGFRATTSYLSTSTTTANLASSIRPFDFFESTSSSSATTAVAATVTTNTTSSYPGLGTGLLNLNKSTSSSLISDMKSLFTKSTSILPSALKHSAVSTVQRDLNTGMTFTTSTATTSSLGFPKEIDSNFDFMKSNKFEEGNENMTNLNYGNTDCSLYGE